MHLYIRMYLSVPISNYNGTYDVCIQPKIIELEMYVDMHVSHKPALEYSRSRDSLQYQNWYIDIVSIHAVRI